MNISEDVILIRPTRLFYEGMSQTELYEITRGIWKLADRRDKAKYAFSIINFEVAGCYRIHSWHKALETNYLIRTDLKTLNQDELKGRFEFLGEIDREMEDKYFGTSLVEYFSKGNANPVRYVNC
jgi:hypothetical protein